MLADLPPEVWQTAARWKASSKLAAALPEEILLWVVYRFLDFSLEFLFDNARYVTWLKSRAIGGTFTLALLHILQAIAFKRDQGIISASKNQALEVLEAVNKLLDELEELFAPDSFRAPRKSRAKQNAHVVTLSNGARIIALPASPRTIRGIHGDVGLDEFGVCPFDKAIFKAAFGIATQLDYRLAAIGTPFGDQGMFFEICEGKLSKGYSHHRTDIYEAVRQGSKIDPAAIRAATDPETFEQEYLLRFLSSASSYLTRELIQAAVERAALWEEDGAGASQDWKPKLYVGVDIGREHDLTAIGRVLEIAPRLFLQLPVEVLRKTPFRTQFSRLTEIIQTEHPVLMRIDQNGIGAQLAEDLSTDYPQIAEGVAITHTVKKALVEGYRVALDKGILGIDVNDKETQTELLCVRRTVTKNGLLTYSAGRSEDGHADRAFAVMLAVGGALGDGSGRAWMDSAGPPTREELEETARKQRERAQWMRDSIQQKMAEALRANSSPVALIGEDGDADGGNEMGVWDEV